MTPTARLAAAIDLLFAMEDAPRRPADAVANNFFRERRYIGGGDRRAVSAQVWAVLRQWRRLAWWIGRAGGEVTPRLLVAAQSVLEGRPAESLQRAFSGGRYAPDPLDPAETRVLRALEGHTLHHPAMPEAVRLEVPDWLLPSLRAQFGDGAAAEIEALGAPATLDLRVNLLKATRDQAREILAADGIAAEPTPLSPWGLRVPSRQPVTASRAFRDGLVEIQDEGSQLVVEALGAAPEMRVADYCAGAGGKTLGVAMCMENRGHIVACDVSAARLEGAVKRLRRAGIHNVERHLLEAGDKWAKRRAGSFDRVLVDAPCTGTGTWRRNPDARLRLRPEDLAELVAKQASILRAAAKLVKPGGRLVYATCSVLREENEAQLEGFLAETPGFERRPMPLSGFSQPPEVLRLSPRSHGTDGFFAALLERTA
ncbi:RsmB/NOP family class I SAM-dependent RNA methyltransferase [Rhizosaccharibacter radicis]|uniref:RsmB/NOP family class I SAM-dependent RNA methyltransferase n=1 Tax=Rhizosaccharibacter radicis TaxID=2782605 RepID=A0ABT1VV33_9PROT|nr:RsmB/NOP family class I SAM-dependent RNA methyltransferase [Acetobacteraceae bacterium KSS12]